MPALSDLVALMIGLGIFIGVPAALLYYFIRSVRGEERSDPDLCEECGYDLRASDGRCPECGGEGRLRYARLKRLRDEWPADAIVPRTPGPAETLVIVYQTDDGVLATLLAEHLEVRGIACHRADPQSIANLGVATVYGSHKLGVWSEDAEEAKQVIDRLLADATEERDDDEVEAGEKATAT